MVIEQIQAPIDLTPMRAFFDEGPPKEVKVRVRYLERLEDAIRRSERIILDALRADLGKSDFEGYASEVGFTLDEIRYLRRHVKKWARPGRVARFGTASWTQLYPL